MAGHFWPAAAVWEPLLIYTGFSSELQVISLEGWVDIMYYVQDAHSFWDWVYFVALIVVRIDLSKDLLRSSFCAVFVIKLRAYNLFVVKLFVAFVMKIHDNACVTYSMALVN